MLREAIAFLICYGIALAILIAIRIIVERVMGMRITSDVIGIIGFIIGVIVTFFLYDVIKDRVRGER